MSAQECTRRVCRTTMILASQCRTNSATRLPTSLPAGKPHAGVLTSVRSQLEINQRLSWVQLGCREIMRNGLGVQAEEYSRVRDNTAFLTSGHPVFKGRPPASLFRAWAAEPSSGARSGTRRQVFRSCGIDLFMSFYLAKQIEYPESDAPQQNTSCRIGYCSRWHLHLAICRFLVIYQTPVVR